MERRTRILISPDSRIASNGDPAGRIPNTPSSGAGGPATGGCTNPGCCDNDSKSAFETRAAAASFAAMGATGRRLGIWNLGFGISDLGFEISAGIYGFKVAGLVAPVPCSPL